MEEKKIDYRNQWQKENQERIIVMVKKGEKERIKNHAEKKSMSLNAYINMLIKRDMKEGK